MMEYLELIIFGGLILGTSGTLFWKISNLCVSVEKIKTAMKFIHPDIGDKLD